MVKENINYHGTLAFPGLPSNTFTQDDVHTFVLMEGSGGQ